MAATSVRQQVCGGAGASGIARTTRDLVTTKCRLHKVGEGTVTRDSSDGKRVMSTRAQHHAAKIRFPPQKRLWRKIMAALLRKAMMEKSAAAVRTKLPTTLAKVIAPRAPNGFFLFNKDERPKVQGEGLKASEVMKELGRRWSSLGDAGQAPYIAQALKAKSNAPPPPTGACAAKTPRLR